SHVAIGRYGSLEGDVPGAVRRQILFDLEHPPQRYVPERVLVAFAPGVTMARDSDALSPAAARSLRTAILSKRRDLSPHAFTNDQRTNAALMSLGVDRADRLFGHIDRGSLSAVRSRAEGRLHRSLVAFDNTYVLHVGAASVTAAVRRLRTLTGVTYVAPDRAVSSMIAGRHPVPDETLREISAYHRSLKTFGRSVRTTTSASTVPPNTAVSLNFQALLNAPGVDAIAAFDEIGARFNQLPGAGEIITNVGLGDADDASAAANPNDPCNAAVGNDGPTTRVVGGQRYLDWMSLPLIPVWVSDANANLSPTAEVCNVDPSLGEVGLDFTMMAPLPDALQRPGKTAPFAMDMLGIAPGASYRWVAPGSTNGIVGTSDVLAAMIGAARQQPAPNVITASLGFGFDQFGFPSRYLEDDPLSESVVAGIVASNVVVCIAANDGTRLVTTAAVGPSGGSAATNVGTTGFTNAGDLEFTTAPSVIPDSGAIDVGATTLDDISSANPQDPALHALANVKTFAETRFNGTLGFSSGFGTRVNVSAPGDNVNALFRTGTDPDTVGLENVGGTSASAPEVAAAAAIALQVARLTGHPFTSAAQVRDLLVATGTPVANPPQSDVQLNVGPQVNVRRVVEQLLANAGQAVAPGIARVAVQGRRTGNYIAQFNERFVNDDAFTTTLDPSYVKLDGPFTRALQNRHEISWPGSDTGSDLNSYITIAPDWEGIPSNATYRLTVAGQPSHVIATTPYIRLLPAQLFAAAGIALTPGTSRTLSLTYRASVGLHAVAESTFQITFGPPAANSRLVLAPLVPSVVSGGTIPVTYDLRSYPPEKLRAPTLDVSLPGVDSLFFQGIGLYPYYTIPLTAPAGTVNVPVSALAGAGTYTLWIDLQPGTTAFGSDISDLAFTRVDAGTARPPAPLLSLPHDPSPPVHTLAVPYRSPFVVSYDVSHVPGASGAIVELAAPPPSPFFYKQGFFGGFNTFRNPNGNALDDDGVITGSLYHVRASGTTGSVTIDPVAANIPATTTVNVRVLPANGTGPIAEASDAGTLQYDGISGVAGLPLAIVQMNSNGSDGYLAEVGNVGNQQTSTELFLLEPFDLRSAALGSQLLALTSPIGGIALFPFVQDDAVIAVSTLDGNKIDYVRAAPLSAGFTGFFFPPGSVPSTAFVDVAAANSTPTRSAYFAQDLATGDNLATRGDVTAGAGFSPPIDLTTALGPNYDPYSGATFAYDPSADRAYLLNEDLNLPCDQQSPQLITFDFNTGVVSMRSLGINAGDTHGMYHIAIDPGTHIAAIATACVVASTGKSRTELTLLDLSSGATTTVYQHLLGNELFFHGGFLLGGDSPVVGIDTVNHLILQRSMFCPEMLRNFDLNARVCLNEYDETGRLVKTVPGLFSDGEIWSPFFSGVNGTTRMGATMGQDEASGIAVQATTVQPYAY
ncbi:MAG TPA: S8 family serine peptidase, partial [Xanthomonadales bacterium]|nr:S8 family serine peptidase [Xanthomonadales bacterium]